MIPCGLIAQKIKYKTDYDDGIIREYCILKDKDKGKLMHGAYKRFLKSKTTYKKILIEKGEFYENKKSGVWTYYNTEEDSIFSYDYSRDSIIYINSNAKRIFKSYGKFYVVATNHGFEVSLAYSVDPKKVYNNDIFPPIYIDGDFELYDKLLKYFLDAINFNNSSSRLPSNFSNNFTAFIIFKISESGKVIDITVDGIYSNAKKELENVLTKDNLEWIPATKNGMYVAYELFIPIFCTSKITDTGSNIFIRYCREDLTPEENRYSHRWPIK